MQVGPLKHQGQCPVREFALEDFECVDGDEGFGIAKPSSQQE